MKTRIIGLVILFICLSAVNSYSQMKHHQIGRLWQTMFEVGTRPNYSPLYTAMNYPGGDFYLGTRKNMDRTGLWIGVKEWTNKFNEYQPYYVSEGGYMNNEATGVVFPIYNKKYVRQRLPLVSINGTAEKRYSDSRDSSTRRSSLDSDEQIVTKWATDVGIEVTRTSYAFANPRHDSYIIQEYVFKNTGNADKEENTVELPNQVLKDVYFGFWRTFIPSLDVGHQQMGGKHDEWCHYYGNQPGDSLRGFWYVYDGDNNYKIFDDTGDPSELNGEFLSPQYPSFGVLYADTDYMTEIDDPNQPATVNFWPYSQVNSHVSGDPDATLYSDLSSGVQSMGSDTREFGSPVDPQIQQPQLLMSFGPYEIPFGEDIRIVMFEAVGSVSRKQAMQKGRDWFAGKLELNGLTGDDAKNAFVATGKDSLHEIARRAEWTWQNGIEAVPDGPESPSLNISAGPAKVELEWYYNTDDSLPPKPDVDTGEYDFSGYRVFRAADDYNNEYYKIWECGGNSGIDVTNKYTDRDVERGQSYYYYVTAYDDGSQNTSGLVPGESVESSHFSNRNFIYAGVPYAGARPQLDSVFVVPNPFHFQGLAFGGTWDADYKFDPNTGGRPEDKLLFVGLPAKATIRIFTGSGNLIKTLEHPNPYNAQSVSESADEMWLQITDEWQTIKSGVYFFHVEGWDQQGNYIGETMGKFIIIR